MIIVVIILIILIMDIFTFYYSEYKIKLNSLEPDKEKIYILEVIAYIKIFVMIIICILLYLFILPFINLKKTIPKTTNGQDLLDRYNIQMIINIIKYTSGIIISYNLISTILLRIRDIRNNIYKNYNNIIIADFSIKVILLIIGLFYFIYHFYNDYKKLNK